MPPAAPLITLHLKSSKTTFLLLIPNSSTFANLQSELLNLITANLIHLPESISSNPPTEPTHIKLGLPKDSSDPKKGFIGLDNGTYGKNGKGLLSAAVQKDGSVLAFVVDHEDTEPENLDFDVEWPVDEYDSQR